MNLLGWIKELRYSRMEVNAHMKYSTYEISHTKLILLVFTLAFFALSLGIS